MASTKQFRNVGMARPGKSVFDLSYEKLFTCDMGELIPVMADEVVPGDVWSIGNEIVVRMQPLVAPVLHEINIYVHYFFVPYRLLWDDWEDFITGGEDGEFSALLPGWGGTGADKSIGSLWDYLGLPTGLAALDAGSKPIDFPARAYSFIWNEYYRDENLQDEVALDSYDVLRRAWEKDYFTSALPWQQRGTGPSFPIAGSTFADFTDATASSENALTENVAFTYPNPPTADSAYLWSGTAGLEPHLVDALNRNEVDLSSATTFNVSDLRLAFQIQKWMERNARAGARYTEFLKAHFGAFPRDERLQRPEYIGGSKQPLVVSEVLQTSSTDATSPQGNLAGHGISVNSQFVGKYRAEEFGVIMGLMSIMPRSMYSQGVDRQWFRETKYDFYFPEFAHLSEQAVLRGELYMTDDEAENKTVFGYQGRYDEMRTKRNMVCGEMRSTLNYWHLGREFGSAPLLNGDFVECNPSKRIFASQDTDGFIVNCGNKLRAVRPMPLMSNPGMIDH